MNDNTELMKKHGLFAAPLNSGEWMVGKACVIYQLHVEDNHAENPYVQIAPTLAEALVKWCNYHMQSL